jgi:leucyl aminopeptidase
MADLHQFRTTPEEPLDCLYILQGTGKDPIGDLEFTAKERKALRAKAKALGPRGEEGEVISGECPIDIAHRVTFIGVGDESRITHSKMRQALNQVMRQATKNREYQIALGVPVRVHGLNEHDSRIFALREAAISDYTYDVFKSKKNEFEKIDGLHILPLARESEELLEERLERVRLLRTSQQLVRDLGNRPANDLTPEAFAAAAKEMAEGVSGLRVTILGMKDIVKEKMGGVLGVSKGSQEEPRVIVIEHRPKKPKKSVVLIGKGVTFDSGGISLKPSKGMGWMKYDMGGAATVVGVMRAVADLDLPIKVVGLIPAVENMPSGTAIKPGDVLTMANGKTVEVDNTDAEGRLILADALHYSARFNPDIIIDYATLTGACVVALGHEAAGAMGNDPEIIETLRKIGDDVGERIWPLPLYDEYFSYIESEWADMKNAGSRWGGAVTAGTFLKQFVPENVSWVHLDVAGVAYNDKEHNGLPKGASGFGVVLTANFLEHLLK